MVSFPRNKQDLLQMQANMVSDKKIAYSMLLEQGCGLDDVIGELEKNVKEEEVGYILVDRWWLSTMVYQNGKAEGLSEEESLKLRQLILTTGLNLFENLHKKWRESNVDVSFVPVVFLGLDPHRDDVGHDRLQVFYDYWHWLAAQSLNRDGKNHSEQEIKALAQKKVDTTGAFLNSLKETYAEYRARSGNFMKIVDFHKQPGAFYGDVKNEKSKTASRFMRDPDMRKKLLDTIIDL
jgi:thymidylate kinase